MKVVLSRNAEEDLEAISDWIARDNPARARSFITELLKACKSIGKAPKTYPFADRQRDPTLRRRIYRNYLIFFDVGATEVAILHVLHGARDYEQIIFPDEPA